jgi:hypothetical protein
MVKDIKSLAINQFIKDFIFKVNLKVVESLVGKMDNYTKVNGLKDWKMVQEYGEALKETHI